MTARVVERECSRSTAHVSHAYTWEKMAMAASSPPPLWRCSQRGRLTGSSAALLAAARACAASMSSALRPSLGRLGRLGYPGVDAPQYIAIARSLRWPWGWLVRALRCHAGAAADCNLPQGLFVWASAHLRARAGSELSAASSGRRARSSSLHKTVFVFCRESDVDNMCRLSSHCGLLPCAPVCIVGVYLCVAFGPTASRIMWAAASAKCAQGAAAISHCIGTNAHWRVCGVRCKRPAVLAAVCCAGLRGQVCLAMGLATSWWLVLGRRSRRGLSCMSLVGFRHGPPGLGRWAEGTALGQPPPASRVVRDGLDHLRVRPDDWEDLRLFLAALPSESVFACANRLVAWHWVWWSLPWRPAWPTCSLRCRRRLLAPVPFDV